MHRLKDVFDDLCSRFILNLPPEELDAPERVCFQVELAHWFYEDFYREKDPSLPCLPFKSFCLKLFKHCPSLSSTYLQYGAEILKKFSQYKIQVPVCGAIILNPNKTKCLMVRGWKVSSPWSFPKGKINEDESRMSCAIREVKEEVGFDIEPFIKENEYIEFTNRGKHTTFYLIQNIPETTLFATQTRKEIGDIAWHSIDFIHAIMLNEAEAQRLYHTKVVRPAISLLEHFLKGISSNHPPSIQTHSEDFISAANFSDTEEILPDLVAIFREELKRQRATVQSQPYIHTITHDYIH